MKKTELILLIISVIGIGLKLLHLPGSGPLIVLGLSIISIFYLYLSFALFNDISFGGIFKKESYTNVSFQRILGAIGVGIALSIICIGAMFRIMHWPGSIPMIGMGLSILLIACIVGLVKYLKNKSEYYTRIFVRAGVIGLTGLVLMLVPSEKPVNNDMQEDAVETSDDGI